MTLASLRKELRKIGYGIKTESLSFGRCATFVHIESGDNLAYNCAPARTWEKWNNLFIFLKEHSEEIAELSKETEIKGLRR
jgi:hypothetical protein